MRERPVDFIVNEQIKLNNKMVPVMSNPNGFKLWMSMCFLGRRGSGKSQAMIRLLEYMINEKVTTPENIFIISPTAYSVNNPWGLLGMPEDNIYTNVDDINKIIEFILDQIKEELDFWKEMRKEFKTERKYIQYYNNIRLIYRETGGNMCDCEDTDIILTPEDLKHLCLNGFQDIPDYWRTIPSYCLVLDDVMNTAAMSNGKGNIFTRVVTNHRHYNLNIFIAAQSLKNGVARAIRPNIMQYCIWRYADKSVIDDIYTEIGGEFMEKEQFYNVYKQITDEPHNFILMDSNPLNKSLKIRKNFNIVIEL